MAVRPQSRQARRLRKSATDAEQILWYALRDLNPRFKIRRQHPIGPYIADLAIPAHKLVIEIDGGQHAASVDSDTERTRQLNGRGYRVIRFWNSDVLGNLDGVVETIIASIEEPTSP